MCVWLFVLGLATSCASSAPDGSEPAASTASTTPTVDVVAPTSAPPAAPPPSATAAELAERTERLPQLSDGGIAPEVVDMLAAVDDGVDWTGTLVGAAFLDVRSSEWRLCWEVLESYPVQCGLSVVLSHAPPAYRSSRDRFEEQTADGQRQPSVVVSRSSISVHGTYDAESALFVPSSHTDP